MIEKSEESVTKPEVNQTAAGDGNAEKRRPNRPARRKIIKIETPHKRGRPFQPGNRFGKGRPVGSRNNATLLLDQLLEGEGPAILRKVIQRARQGDPTAMRLCMERLCPPRRERRLKLDLPEIQTAGDVSAAFRIVVQALGQGDITTEQAAHLINILEFGRRAMETERVSDELAKLEEQREIERQWWQSEDPEERAA